MKIFMHLAKKESIIPISAATMNQICYLTLNRLFAYTVYFKDDVESCEPEKGLEDSVFQLDEIKVKHLHNGRFQTKI